MIFGRSCSRIALDLLRKGVEQPVKRMTSSSSNSTSTPSLRLTAEALHIDAPNFGLSDSAFPWIWLRDACDSPSSVDPSTKQKLFRTSDIPHDIKAESVEVLHGDSAEDPSIAIRWSAPLKGASEPGRSVFPLSRLGGYADRIAWSLRHWKDLMTPVTWDHDSLTKHDLHFRYSDLADPETLRTALVNLIKYGIVFFRDVPTDDKSDASCKLIRLASYLGEIRRTWYGDKVWDVKSVPDAKNIAYTNLDLGLHMDLVHFETPPRYQLLHFLHGHRTLTGGESYFVDSYRAARIVEERSPEDYRTLCQAPVAFEYHNGGHWRHWERPTIELSEDAEFQGPVKAVNYSPPFQAPQLLGSDASMAELHRSLSTFSEVLDEAGMRYEVGLRPGDCVAFDNRRVLHARRSFEWDSTGAGEVGRWLKGCYVEGDSVSDKLRTLSESRSRR